MSLKVISSRNVSFVLGDYCLVLLIGKSLMSAELLRAFEPLADTKSALKSKALLVKYARLLCLIALRLTPFSLALVRILWRSFFPGTFSQLAWSIAYVFAIHFPKSLGAFNSIRKADKAIPYKRQKA